MIIFDEFWQHFGGIFWVILISFWCHFGVILVSFYPPAAPTNRHRAVGLDIGLIDLTKEFWSQVGTFFQPAWAQHCTKIAQKMHKNRPKMAPRWLLGGSWGHLGGKMAPRWSQEGSKVEKSNSFPPCWGPSWDPILVIFGTRGDYKRLQEPLGWHVVSRHQVFSENGPPGTPLDMKNQAKPLEGCPKSGFACLHIKWP